MARRLFWAAAGGLGLPEEAAYDGATMASELAANSLHARAVIQAEGALGYPVVGAPELWLYLRRAGDAQELVCKAFDALPGWKDGRIPDPAALGPADAVPTDAVGGRGLPVIHALSGGRWGHHLTRSRLGGWKVPGKAVWFAVPVPPGQGLDRFRQPPPEPGEAAGALERMLMERGITRMVRKQTPASRIAVLSVRRDLTVWCRRQLVTWTSRAGDREWREITDLVDAAEQIVRAHEELASGAAAARWS